MDEKETKEIMRAFSGKVTDLLFEGDTCKLRVVIVKLQSLLNVYFGVFESVVTGKDYRLPPDTLAALRCVNAKNMEVVKECAARLDGLIERRLAETVGSREQDENI